MRRSPLSIVANGDLVIIELQSQAPQDGAVLEGFPILTALVAPGIAAAWSRGSMLVLVALVATGGSLLLALLPGSAAGTIFVIVLVVQAGQTFVVERVQWPAFVVDLCQSGGEIVQTAAAAGPLSVEPAA